MQVNTDDFAAFAVRAAAQQLLHYIYLLLAQAAD
jgi:hypothetical protein